MQLQTISKALLAAAAGSLFALGTSPAFAQDTADLAVKGTIVPAACSANFTGGDTVDFGTIKVVDLLPNSYNLLGEKTTELNVNCSSDKQVTFTVLDMQSASSLGPVVASLIGTNSPGHIFGLGTATVGASNVKLGAYSIHSGQPTVDGVSKDPIYAAVSGGGWGVTGFVIGTGDASYRYSAGSAAGGPTRGQAFNIPLKITAALNKGSELQVAKDTPLNGQAVFTINYQ